MTRTNRNPNNNFLKLSTSKYYSLIVASLLVFIALFINMAEAVSVRSLRSIFTLVFAYYLVSSFLLHKVVLTKSSFNYILFLVAYTFCFYLFGSGNNLIIHLLTICFGVVMLYNALLASNFSLGEIWGFAKKVWFIIYFTLVVELVLVVLGYQLKLYAMFPEETRALGLPAYRSLYNTFASFFGLDFTGLNSITLQAQAFGQFCVMLTVLGFSYTRATYSKNNILKAFTFMVAPLLIFSVSPNITSSVLFMFIVTYVLFLKFYLSVYSFGKFIALSGFVFALIFFYYVSDLGFVRKYNFEDLYDLFLSQQIDYLLSKSLPDYLIGVDLHEYHSVNEEFEIGYLSYLMVSGAVFAVVNLFIIFKFTWVTLKQAKFINQIKSADKKIIEIQLTNALFVLVMLLSSMHFPVITNYLGTLIFVFHLAYGFYILKINRGLISHEGLSARR
jgi:hypothetical protein